MHRLSRDLRFYTFAIPAAALASWGYADSFKSFKNIASDASAAIVSGLVDVDKKYPHIGYDGLIMRQTLTPIPPRQRPMVPMVPTDPKDSMALMVSLDSLDSMALMVSLDSLDPARPLPQPTPHVSPQ
jgi:hypothetical protein